MHSITRSYMVTAALLFDFFISIILLSEGHTWIGISCIAFAVVAILCSFFHERWMILQNCSLSDEVRFSYRYYKRRCFSEWLNNNASVVTEQSFFMVVARVLVSICIIAFCVYCLFSDWFNLFQYPVLNKLVLVFGIFFSIAFLLFGLRFCALPAFVVYCFVMTEYLLQRLYFIFNGSTKFWGMFTYIVIILPIILSAYVVNIALEKKVGYFNLQIFEHEGNVQITDMFLKFFVSIINYDILYKFTFSQTSDFDDGDSVFCNDVASMAKQNGVIFAGLVCNNLKKCNEIYFYINSANVDCNKRFEERFRSLILKHFGCKCSLKTMEDANWKVYSNLLYPSNSELCEIISRNHIKSLFVDGMSFDRDYSLTFYVFFKEKEDMLAFENTVEYYGFKLSYGSFDGDFDELVEDYPYCGEYRIVTYISVRRLEYLNRTLLKATEEFGCVYLGDWAVEEQY